MKIIRKGEKLNNQKFPVVGECEICGCEFEFKKDDITIEWNSEGMWLYATCPQCGYKNDGIIPGWYEPFNNEIQE